MPIIAKEIQNPLDLIHYLVQGENFDVLKPAVNWGYCPASVWSRAIAAALQVFDSTVTNNAASVQLRRAEQFVWRAKLANEKNVVHLHCGLVVDIAAVVSAVQSVSAAATVKMHYDGAMNLLIELPKTIDRRQAIGQLIESLKRREVEAYCA